MLPDRTVIDHIEELAETSPAGLMLLIIHAANELGAAVDEGRASPDLLRNLASHTKHLAEHGPLTKQQ